MWIRFGQGAGSPMIETTTRDTMFETALIGESPETGAMGFDSGVSLKFFMNAASFCWRVFRIVTVGTR